MIKRSVLNRRLNIDMKKKLPYLLPSIIFFIGAPIVWILCFREVPLRISPETTYITEPKTADGLCIDYFAAIKNRFEPRSKPEENGFRMVVAALGKSPYFDQPDWYWESLCKELDLDPDLTPTLKFESPHEFLKREYLLWLDENESVAFNETVESKPDEPTDTEKLHVRLQLEPWTVEEFPFLVRWIEENSPMLDLVAEAVRKELLFLPLIQAPRSKETLPGHSGYFTFPADYPLLHFLSGGFAYRAQYRFGKGDFDGAVRDIADQLRLRMHQAQRPYEHMEDAFTRLRQRTAHWDRPEEWKEKLRRNLENLPPPISTENVLLFQRLNHLGMLSDVHRLHHAADPHDPGFNYINWNVAARTCNELFDRMDTIVKERSMDEMIDRAEQLRNEEFLSHRSFLSRLAGKPLFVDERSAELGFYSSFKGVFVLVFRLKSIKENEAAKEAILSNDKEPEVERSVTSGP